MVEGVRSLREVNRREFRGDETWQDHLLLDEGQNGQGGEIGVQWPLKSEEGLARLLRKPWGAASEAYQRRGKTMKKVILVSIVAAFALVGSMGAVQAWGPGREPGFACPGGRMADLLQPSPEQLSQ